MLGALLTGDCDHRRPSSLFGPAELVDPLQRLRMQPAMRPTQRCKSWRCGRRRSATHVRCMRHARNGAWRTLSVEICASSWCNLRPNGRVSAANKAQTELDGGWEQTTAHSQRFQLRWPQAVSAGSVEPVVQPVHQRRVEGGVDAGDLAGVRVCEVGLRGARTSRKRTLFWRNSIAQRNAGRRRRRRRRRSSSSRRSHRSSSSSSSSKGGLHTRLVTPCVALSKASFSCFRSKCRAAETAGEALWRPGEPPALHCGSPNARPCSGGGGGGGSGGEAPWPGITRETATCTGGGGGELPAARCLELPLGPQLPARLVANVGGERCGRSDVARAPLTAGKLSSLPRRASSDFLSFLIVLSPPATRISRAVSWRSSAATVLPPPLPLDE